MSDDPPLVYHQCTLYPDDIDLLNDGKWLNDAVIHFAFEYFQHEEFKEIASLCKFVSPQSTYLLAHEEDDDDFADLMIPLLHSTGVDLFFFPINDSGRVQTGSSSGSHWTLLVYNRVLNSFLFLDSSPSTNTACESTARQLSRRLASTSFCKTNTTPTTTSTNTTTTSVSTSMSADTADTKAASTSSCELTSSDESKAVNFIVPKGPKQNNSYDCGVFVIQYAWALCHYIQEEQQQQLLQQSSHDDETTNAWMSTIASMDGRSKQFFSALAPLTSSHKYELATREKFKSIIGSMR